MKTIGTYIREKRTKLGLTAKEVARKVGISHIYLFGIEKDRHHPTFKVIMDILKALNADFQDFLEQTGYLPVNVEPVELGKGRAVPVVSWVTAGRWHEVVDPYEPGVAEDWVITEEKGRNVFALRVKGDSMEPEFKEGEIIIVNPHLQVEPGDYVIFKNDDDEVTFKQLKRYNDIYVLHPLNPSYPDIVLSKEQRYRIIGKVVEKRRRF
ncbi:MAG: XRE family transcriptional regulator [Candidatus Aenigmatarchaeota archaeon]